MPFGLEAGARGEKRKQWKRTGKSPSAVRSKAYRVTHCCSAALLVLACCWWTVLCGWVGLGRARMEAPADPVSPVMDEFGWKLLVVLWPCWLDACFTGRRCDPLSLSEQGPRTIKQLHSKQIKFKKKQVKGFLMFSESVELQAKFVLLESHIWIRWKLKTRWVQTPLLATYSSSSRGWEGEKEAVASAQTSAGSHTHTLLKLLEKWEKWEGRVMYHSPNTTGSSGTLWLQQPGMNLFTQFWFLFSPHVEKGGKFTTVYFSLWLEVVFGMVIDLTYVALH